MTEEDVTGRLGDIPGYGLVNLRVAYQPEDMKYAPKFAFGVKTCLTKSISRGRPITMAANLLASHGRSL